MYLLDTNVVSELRKARSTNVNKNVVTWCKKISPSNLFISVITILELEIGILSVEKRDKSQGAILRAWMENHVLPSFTDRVIYIDTAIALRCAKLHVPNRQADRDALIAATALVHGMAIVTRNIADFESSGVDLVNPWEKQSTRKSSSRH